jgi:hypothetical protein
MARFSLSTMLICIFVAALVLSYCMNLPVREVDPNWRFTGPKGHYTIHRDYSYTVNGGEYRPPRRNEVLLRLAWFEPLSLALTLFAIRGVRKLWRSIPHKSKAELSDPSSSTLY